MPVALMAGRKLARISSRSFSPHGLLERRDPHFELVFRQARRDRSTKLGAYGSGGVRDRLSSERVREGVDCRSRQNSLDARHTPEERFATVGRGGRRGEPL